MKRSLVAASLIFAAAGCSWNDEPMLGVAQATITVVPPMVSCIQITVAGTRTEVRGFSVTPGTSSVENLMGLPVGAVTFTGAAFSQACTMVNASTVPTWLSDPTPATLVAGQVAAVTLKMKKNAAANVGVDFQDDDGGTTPPSGDGGPGPVLDLSAPPSDLGTTPPPSDLGFVPPSDLSTTPAPSDLAGRAIDLG